MSATLNRVPAKMRNVFRVPASGNRYNTGARDPMTLPSVEMA